MKNVRKKGKNLTKETIQNLSALRFTPGDDEETEGLMRNAGDSNGSRGSNHGRVPTSALWKTLAFVMFGMLILFATDSLEFKKYTLGDKVEASTSNLHAEAEKTHAVLGGTVEKKSPVPVTSPPTATPTANPTVKATPPPTLPPTLPPTVPATPPPTLPATVPATPPLTEAKKEEPNGNLPAPVDVATTESIPGRHTYTRRGQPMSDADRKAMEEKWGTWTLGEDPKDRPKNDYYSAYPNRDIPRSKFPPNAWQTDKDWLSKFLPESIKLVDRAIEAILEEYDQPKDGTSDLFHVEKYDTWTPNIYKEQCKKQVGCTTTKTFDNLKRRLLHAVMTEDMFVFAMGGHSSAAGHGNHFTQSYTLQVQWILEGVFARLGVRHQSRNFGLGGLGTSQSGMATKQIYGHDVDILMWDSGMTEREEKARDLFFRQGILGGGKVPMLLSALGNVIGTLHEHVDADVFLFGDQTMLTQADTLEEVQKLPWAAQYVRCGSEISGICRENEYAGECWIERDDFTPQQRQQKPMGGRASWHPGNRKHQIIGRAIAFAILEALKEALTMWNTAKDYELPDDSWHVTPLYDNTRSKLENLGEDIGTCVQYKEPFSSFMCNHAVKARLEFTPRAYPDYTNLRTLMPPSMAEHINDPPESVYNGPDVFNKDLHPPAGAIDVLNIIEAGVPYSSTLLPDYTSFHPKPKFEKAPSLPVGKGYYLNTYAGFCDGSVDSWCSKQASQQCLLYGHNDGRNGIYMDSFCGWFVTNLPEVKHGFIALKIETWHQPRVNPKTSSWSSINNERRNLFTGNDGPHIRSSSNSNQSLETADYYFDHEERQLKAKVPDYCPEFKFEFAIDGKVTSWNYDQYMKNMFTMQRVVEVLKIAEDPNMTGGQEKEIEFAFRITGCTNVKMMHITHLYWA